MRQCISCFVRNDDVADRIQYQLSVCALVATRSAEPIAGVLLLIAQQVEVSGGGGSSDGKRASATLSLARPGQKGATFRMDWGG